MTYITTYPPSGAHTFNAAWTTLTEPVKGQPGQWPLLGFQKKSEDYMHTPSYNKDLAEFLLCSRCSISSYAACCSPIGCLLLLFALKTHHFTQALVTYD
jgi:hypothetical protein